jgi:hypothetical protein
VVYEKSEAGVYTKIAPAKDFAFVAGSGEIINKIIIVSVLWILSIGGGFYYKSMKKKRLLARNQGL